jgi:hypothetical protein
MVFADECAGEVQLEPLNPEKPHPSRYREKVELQNDQAFSDLSSTSPAQVRNAGHQCEILHVTLLRQKEGKECSDGSGHNGRHMRSSEQKTVLKYGHGDVDEIV